MTKKVKLFLPTAAHEEMMFQYKDDEHALRKLFFSLILPMSSSAKKSKLHNDMQVNVIKDGKPALEVFDFDDTKLDENTIKTDPNWIPEKYKDNKDKMVIHELSVSDRLYDELIFFGRMYITRLQIYGESLDKKNPDYDKQKPVFPDCLEQVIQEGIVEAFIETLANKIDQNFTSEFDESNQPDPPKKGSR